MYKDDSTKLKCFLLKCPEQKKEEFASGEAALLISVGQPYHEGEKMWAMMSFIEKSFKKCNIMVNDSLQRHTIMLNDTSNLTNEEAYKKSIEDGREWVERNSKFFKSLGIPYELHYWNTWLNHGEYAFYKNKIDDLYKNDQEFKFNMDVTIKEFIVRNQAMADIKGVDQVYNFCLEYLLEECAIIMGVWQNLDYNFILYPGKMISILKYTRSILVKEDILYWLHVKFRRNNKKLYRETTGDVLCEGQVEN